MRLKLHFGSRDSAGDPNTDFPDYDVPYRQNIQSGVVDRAAGELQCAFPDLQVLPVSLVGVFCNLVIDYRQSTVGQWNPAGTILQIEFPAKQKVCAGPLDLQAIGYFNIKIDFEGTDSGSD